MFSVAYQHYKTGGSEEYVIVGNDAIVQCNVPSFVADFVTVQSWVDSEGNDILRHNSLGNASPAFHGFERKPHPKYRYWIWFPIVHYTDVPYNIDWRW